MFAKTLKSLRTDANLTQHQLATRLKVATSTIGMYESGKRMPDTSILAELARIFNVSIDYLIGHTSPTQSKPTTQLTEKDERDIANDVDSMMNKIQAGEDGPLYYRGDEMDHEDLELFKDALEFALKAIKVKNKEKYTPKKYR